MSEETPIKKVLRLFKSDPDFADAVSERFFQRSEPGEVSEEKPEAENAGKDEQETLREELALAN